MKNYLRRAECSFSSSFFDDLTTKLQCSYSNSWDEAEGGYTPSVMLGILPHIRHYKGLSALQSTAESHGYDVFNKPNKAKNCTYIQVENNGVVTTISRVNSKGEMVRTSWWREDLSQTNRCFLPGFEPKSDGQAIYCLLLHGADVHNPKKLGFLQLAIPDSEYSGYIAVKDIFCCDSALVNTTEQEVKEATSKLRVKEVRQNA